MKERPWFWLFVKWRCLWLLRLGWIGAKLWDMADNRVDAWHQANGR